MTPFMGFMGERDPTDASAKFNDSRNTAGAPAYVYLLTMKRAHREITDLFTHLFRFRGRFNFASYFCENIFFL
jgi:hypothetical protein